MCLALRKAKIEAAIREGRLKHFKWAVKSTAKKPEEWVPIAERLAKENSGIVPMWFWLKKNGYGGLALAMHHHPELFAHLEWENKGGRLAKEWVSVAERLAKENDGKIPNLMKLREMGYGPLGQAIERYPELFAHLEWENKRGRLAKEWVSVAERLAKENDGKLPVQAWLHKNGYGGLVGALQVHPELFAHLECETGKGRKPEEWVSIAERLAKENDGKLPCIYWLQENGYSALCPVLKANPELFVHLEQEYKRHKSPEEWVPVAEKMAKENGGTVPTKGWLKKNGLGSLGNMLRKYPELFAHLKQERGRMKPEEWVPIAERLAKENDGKLPIKLWIHKNGYGGLVGALQVHPELFAHLEQENKNGRSPEEWVPVAERLAKENGGMVPSYARMKNGYSGLYAAKYNCPELFAHLEWEKKYGKILEWVPVAERLAKENDGKLPRECWMRNNGYGGLGTAMSNHPELFAHLKREDKKHKSSEEWVLVAEKMAKENGKLPNWTWLRKNGYSGLYSAKYRCPELFAHIKQDKRMRKTA